MLWQIPYWRCSSSKIFFGGQSLKDVSEDLPLRMHLARTLQWPITKYCLWNWYLLLRRGLRTEFSRRHPVFVKMLFANRPPKTDLEKWCSETSKSDVCKQRSQVKYTFVRSGPAGRGTHQKWRSLRVFLEDSFYSFTFLACQIHPQIHRVWCNMPFYEGCRHLNCMVATKNLQLVLGESYQKRSPKKISFSCRSRLLIVGP